MNVLAMMFGWPKFSFSVFNAVTYMIPCEPRPDIVRSALPVICITTFSIAPFACHFSSAACHGCGFIIFFIILFLNPLTPVPPITAHDKPWPLFHFWRHQLWPILASSILNFCRSKRFFQWYPDQGDRLNGPWNMHKNAMKFEWKTQSEISCNYGWLLQSENCLSQGRFLRLFRTRSKPSRRSITAAKR